MVSAEAALARGEAHGASLPRAELPAGMPLPGDEVTPMPQPALVELSAPSADASQEWIEPTVAGAMSSLAGTARCMATASIAMASAAVPLSGARRWPEVPPPADVPARAVMPGA